MSSFDDIISAFNNINIKAIALFETFEKSVNATVESYRESVPEIENKLKQILDNIDENNASQKTVRRNKNKKNANIESLPVLEPGNHEVDVSNSSYVKTKRMASQLASLMINKQSHLNLQLKMRRPSESNDQITSQKMGIMQTISIKVESPDENEEPVEIKNLQNKEYPSNEAMLPPSSPPKTRKLRQKKIKTEVESSDTENESSRPVRSGRKASKKDGNKNNLGIMPEKSRRRKKEDSDILILADAPVPCISLLDTDSESEVPVSTETKHKETETVKPVVNEKSDSDPEEKVIEKEPDKEKSKKVVQNEVKKTSKEKVQQEKEPRSNKEKNKENELPEEKIGQKHERSWSSADEEDNKRVKKRTKKGTKTAKKGTIKKQKLPVEKIPFVALENIKQETSVYEDALSNSKENNLLPTTPTLCDQTYQISTSSKQPMNETITFTKANVVNSTFCKDSAMNSVPEKQLEVLQKNVLEEERKEIQKEMEACSVRIEKNPLVEEIMSKEITTASSTLETNIGNEEVCRVSIERNPLVEEIISKEITTASSTIETNSSNNNKKDIANETIVLSKKETPQWKEPVVKSKTPDQNEPLLTDDESDISPAKDNLKEVEKTPKQPITSINISAEKEKLKDKKTKKAVKTKPMFSPYANSPVKKRVAAFEQLGSADKNAPATTTRVTRTKTRKMIEEKENEQKTSKIPPPSKVVASKYITPLANHKLKSLIPHTDGKPVRAYGVTGNKQNMSTLSNSDVTQKSQSAVKLTRTELQERKEEDQRRKIEKEDEAKRKKDALMQAKIEENKRIREEKMIRAQKAREEKERLKEEKLRQIIAEKEEKLKEEQEKRKAYLAQKAAELEEQRKIVEQNRIAKQKEEEEQKRKMLWKKQQEQKAKKNKPPPLPTADNYDTDSSDESAERPRVPVPSWAQKSQLFPVLSEMRFIPKHVVNLFFNVQPTTPDLEEIFENIPKNYLKRNSSAVWRTPPRYSMLPKH